jgi:hypothetical protein
METEIFLQTGLDTDLLICPTGTNSQLPSLAAKEGPTSLLAQAFASESYITSGFGSKSSN